MTSIRHFVLLACLCGGSLAHAALPGPPAPIAVFTNSRLSGNEYLGVSVATDGERVLIGTGQGTAYLYNPFTRQQLAKVTLPDPRFDTSVTLQGNTGLVASSGAAVLYNFSNLPSVTSKQLTPNDGGFLSGQADMSGDIIIAGATSDESAGDLTGAAYLFDRVTGTQFAKLIPSDGQMFDHFGIDVAVDGNRAVVGSPQSIFTPGGAVYLFDAQPGVVGSRELDKYTVSGTPNSVTHFGLRVDLSGANVLALGNGGPTFLWPQTSEPAPLPSSSMPSTFGEPIDIYGPYAVIGYGGEDRVAIRDVATGAVLTNLIPPPGSPIGFGYSVALAGDLLVVGAPGGDPARSAVFVYRLQDVLVPEPTAFVLTGLAALLFIPRRRQMHHISGTASTS